VINVYQVYLSHTLASVMRASSRERSSIGILDIPRYHKCYDITYIIDKRDASVSDLEDARDKTSEASI